MSKHWDKEEEFHANEDRRKFSRNERKLAQKTDRSKYKKTDQEKIQKALPPDDPNLKRGRVLSISPEAIQVDSDGQIFRCSLKGALKKEKKREKKLIAVGDFVRFCADGAISYIEERKSILSRSDLFHPRKMQLIAVNIDQVLITVSVVAPPLASFLVDRYIIAAQKGNMQPIIVINKIDLLANEPVEKALFEEFLNIYQKLGIPVIAVSVATGEGIDMLKNAMKEKASVFSGPSGVGKTSLINAILGTSFATRPVAEKTKRGAHTTTSAHLLPIEGGGFCIDTPGIGSFGVWALSQQEIRGYFTEFEAYSPHCKFPDCSHLVEPGCAVKKALDEHQISPLRFASYSALMEKKERNFS